MADARPRAISRGPRSWPLTPRVRAMTPAPAPLRGPVQRRAGLLVGDALLQAKLLVLLMLRLAADGEALAHARIPVDVDGLAVARLGEAGCVLHSTSFAVSHLRAFRWSRGGSRHAEAHFSARNQRTPRSAGRREPGRRSGPPERGPGRATARSRAP